MSSDIKENANDDEISINDVLIKTKASIKYLKTKLVTIFIVGLLGAVAGIGYAFIKKTIYTASCTFVLDDNSKGGSLGQYAGLASLAGVDLGSGGDGGLFTGENIFELYKSRLMIEKTLLSVGNFDGKSELLIDRYIEFNNLRKRWLNKDNITNINFNGDPAKFNRKQDSIITDLTKIFNKKYLIVSKPDKKLSIINVEVKSTDELFAEIFTDKIVENVNNFYIQTRTKRSVENVEILQHQADSVKSALNTSLNGVASDNDAVPNSNPFQSSLRVPSQKKQVDVQASTAIYAEIVKNLEVSKISLRKETPLIQIVDIPVLPLDNDKVGKLLALIIGFVGAVFIASFIYALKGIFVKTTPDKA